MHSSLKTDPIWTVAWDAIRNRVAELSALPPDWDSYGAAAPTPMALNCVGCLITDLANDLGQAAVPNEAFPNPDGGIELEWTVGDRLLGLEIGPGGDLHYLLRIGEGPKAKYTKGTTEASTAEINNLLAALR